MRSNDSENFGLLRGNILQVPTKRNLRSGKERQGLNNSPFSYEIRLSKNVFLF